MCFGCSKEPSHRVGSFEYLQQLFWMRNKEYNFPKALLSGGLGGSEETDDALFVYVLSTKTC